MFNKNKKKEEEAGLNTLYISNSQGSVGELYPITDNYENIYSVLISAYIFEKYKNYIQQDKNYEEQILDMIKTSVGAPFQGYSNFELEDKNDYLEFKKEMLSMYSINRVIKTIPSPNGIDKKLLSDVSKKNKIDNLVIDFNRVYYNEASKANVFTNINSQQEEEKIRSLAEMVKNSDRLSKIFDLIDEKYKELQQTHQINNIPDDVGVSLLELLDTITDGIIIEKKEDIKFGKTNYDFSFYKCTKTPTNPREKKSDFLLVQTHEGLYKNSSASIENIKNNISSFKLIDKKNKITKCYIKDLSYAYEYSEKTGKYRIIDVNNNTTYKTANNFGFSDFVELNGCYYGVGKAIGVKAVPIPDDSFLTEKDFVYKTYKFESYNKKGEKIEIVLPVNFEDKNYSPFPTNNNFFYEVYVDGKKISDTDQKFLMDFIQKLQQGNIIEKDAILSFTKDEELSKNNITNLKLYSAKNSGKHLDKEPNIIQNAIDNWYKEVTKKKEEPKTAQKKEAKREDQLEVDLSALQKNTLDLDEEKEKNKDFLKVDELTAFEKFIDFFIELFGLGETYEDDRQAEYEKNVNKLVEQVNERNFEITNNKKIVVNRIIKNFENGYQLEEKEYESVLAKLKQDGLKDAVDSLENAKEMCEMMYAGKKNNAGDNLLTLYKAKKAKTSTSK